MTTQLTNRGRLGLVIAVGLVAALLVWLLVKGDDDNGSSSAPAPPAADSTIPAQDPVEISPEALSELASQQTIYWAGEMPDTKLELTVTNTGNVFVRYLDEAAPIGTEERDFLTVGTYPARAALELLQQEAVKTDAVTEELTAGGLVMVSKDQPQSVYLAYPGTNYQVEVYDPSAERALDLVLSAGIEPVT